MANDAVEGSGFEKLDLGQYAQRLEALREVGADEEDKDAIDVESK